MKKENDWEKREMRSYKTNSPDINKKQQKKWVGMGVCLVWVKKCHGGIMQTMSLSQMYSILPHLMGLQ